MKVKGDHKVSFRWETQTFCTGERGELFYGVKKKFSEGEKKKGGLSFYCASCRVKKREERNKKKINSIGDKKQKREGSQLQQREKRRTTKPQRRKLKEG